MKKLSPFFGFVCLLFCLISCKENDKFELKGEVEGLTSDMLLVVYDDPESKIDTIYPQGGKFKYEFVPDTLNMFRLVDGSGSFIPIFADKGWKVSLKGRFAEPVVEGDGFNGEYQEFLSQIKGENDYARQEQLAEAFIKSHLQSFVSAYLIDKYFVQKMSPDEKKIKELIDPLDGKIKDSRVIGLIIKSMSEKKERNYINYFSVMKRDGRYLSWNTHKRQYTLINFWATWDKESVLQRDSLYRLCEEFGEDDLRVLNFSLDYDKKAWAEACKDDTGQWIELCDAKGWNNSVLEQINVSRLPANVLVSSGRRIEAVGLFGNELKIKLEELTEKKDK